MQNVINKTEKQTYCFLDACNIGDINAKIKILFHRNELPELVNVLFKDYFKGILLYVIKILYN